MSASTPAPTFSVLPGRPRPASLVACMLGDAAFVASAQRSADLLRQLLQHEGYEVAGWGPLSGATKVPGRIGWSAVFQDPALEAQLRLEFFAAIAEDGSVQVHAQVVDPQQHPAALVAGVCMASTAPLRDWLATNDALQRLSNEIDTQMSFIELASTTTAASGTLRAIRVAKRFREPESWVPDAAQVLLTALSLS